MSWALLATLSLWLFPALWLALFLFTPTKEGPKAQHTMLWLYKPKGPTNPDGSDTEAAHVQERGEYRLGKVVGKLAGLPFNLISVDPLVTVIVVIVQAAVMIVANDRFNRLNFVDYAGHGAEIMAAERAGVIGYREAEIERMSDDRDKRGDDVGAGLDRWRWLARVVFVLGVR